MKQIIVISAINIRSGGTLTILRDCLSYISQSGITRDFRVIALVHNRNLADFPNIEYIEFPRSIKHWVYRLYYEYVYFRILSRRMNPYLWLSLHDITPNVRTERQAVYMHNPSIVNSIKWSDLRFEKTYVIFSLLYKFVYKINIKRNNYCIVQQNWFRKVCSQKLGVPENRFIVARPNIKKVELDVNSFAKKPCRTFFYPSFPRPFKNFETVCRAADILNKKGITDFKVVLTIDGSENNYSKWIKSLCNDIPNIVFTGLLTKDEMYRQYDETDCLIFPSRLETWGLPISEFIPFNRPMIIADELYSHETSAGASAVAFYKTNDEHALAKLMEDAINCRWKKFVSLESETVNHPYADSYEALFDLLLGPSN